MLRAQITNAIRLAQFLFVLNLMFSVAAPRDLRAQTSASAGVASTPLSLSITPLGDKVKTGTPVKVNVTVKNLSNRDIQLWTDSRGVEIEYKVDITNENGNAPPDAKFKRDIKGLEDPAFLTPDTPLNFSGGMRTLKPGEALTDLFNVSRLHDLSEVGKYTIQLRRFDSESNTYVKSNTITVTVTP